MNFKPLHDRVLVKRMGSEEKTAGGIIIPDSAQEKPMEAKVMTTHDHVNMFAIISFLLGFVFYFNSVVSNKLKFFLLIEPYFSILITFSSMWLMRFYHPFFVYIMMISASLMYSIWYIMIFISLYELNKK